MANFAGDLSQQIASVSLYATSTGVTTNASAAGSSVDLGYGVSNIFTAYQIVGNLAGTGSPTVDGKVQESTDGTNNWTDVTGGAFTQVTASNTSEGIPFKPTKRYVRTTATVAGTNPVAEMTTLIYAPKITNPSTWGGFNTTAAPAN